MHLNLNTGQNIVVIIVLNLFGLTLTITFAVTVAIQPDLYNEIFDFSFSYHLSRPIFIF